MLLKRSESRFKLDVYEFMMLLRISILDEKQVFFYMKSLEWFQKDIAGCSNINKKRLSYAEYKKKLTSRKRQKFIHGQKKSIDDDDIDKKRTLYDSDA